jgi:hypothetical protein
MHSETVDGKERHGKTHCCEPEEHVATCQQSQQEHQMKEVFLRREYAKLGTFTEHWTRSR